MSNIAALTGTIANMAAIETAFQATWRDADFMSAARRPLVLIKTDLAAGQTLRLLVRSGQGDGNNPSAPVWMAHPKGAITIPSKVSTAADDWSLIRLAVGTDWSGLVVWASAACTVQLAISEGEAGGLEP